jgi:hypothetical protein
MAITVKLIGALRHFSSAGEFNLDADHIGLSGGARAGSWWQGL